VAELEGEVQELHRQLSEQAARTNAAVAAAQDRAYWLDRWHLDLNALMRRPGAAALRGLLRSVRGATRRAGRVLGAARGRG
jgi:hypothetical protein